ncbi:MAG TPA: hypothetical protein VN457_00225 [Chlamydiales bacterium]|nr:hypothetical protein [Chlamydiales bacterium]
MLPRTKLIVAGVVLLVAVFVLDQWRQRSSSEHEPAQEEKTVEVSEEWKEFQPTTGLFKVKLPALPQHASDAVPLPSGQGLIKYDMYLSQKKNGRTFMVSLIQYPELFDTSSPNELLDGVMKEMMAGNVNNKLKMVQKGEFRTYPAIDFEIQNNDVLLRSKTFLAGKTLFVLTLIDRSEKDLDSEFAKFSDSLLVNGMQPAALPSNTVSK